MKKAINIDTLPSLMLQLWGKFSSRRKRQFFLLIGLMLISAFAEVVSLGAVLPFIVNVVPDEVLNYPIIANIASAWGITSAEQLVLPLSVGFALVALLAGLIRTLLLWASTRTAFSSGADFGIEVFDVLSISPIMFMFRLTVVKLSAI